MSDYSYNKSHAAIYGMMAYDDLVRKYDREDLRREKSTRIERDARRMNQSTTNKKRGKAARKKP